MLIGLSLKYSNTEFSTTDYLLLIKLIYLCNGQAQRWDWMGFFAV